MRTRIFLKLALSFLLVLAVAVGTLDVLIRDAWEKSYREDLQASLTENVTQFARQVDASPPDARKIAQDVSAITGARATIIDHNGVPLVDTQADPEKMENHATRPEFIAALHGQIGSNIRRSHTVGVEFLYVAAPAKVGAVRLAYPIVNVRARLAAVRKNLLVASLIGIVIAMLVAGFLAQYTARRLRRIADFAGRIAAGDLSARIEEGSYDEIGRLAAALDETATHLERNFAELENARTQLEALLNSIQDAVLAISPERRSRWANGAMLRLLPHGIRMDAPLVDTVRDPDLLRMVHECLDQHEVRTARVSALRGRTFEATAAPIADGGAVLVLHDVTEVERVDRTRRDFIANVSHELRTPLTSIQGYADTLLEALSAERTTTREFLEIILQNAHRMTRLTEDLLALARVESGEQQLHLEPAGANELLESAEQNFRAIVEARGMAIEIESASDDATVLVDREAVYHVFSNLIDNATKYAAAGEKITVGARKVEGAVEFYVRDYGAGIAYEHLPRLFERFYRVDKARSRDTGGTGLGLAIVKHIVLNHGGAVRVESELNHGSTFYFQLPLAPVESSTTHSSVTKK